MTIKSIVPLLAALLAAPAHALVLLTESNPPFNYEENGTIDGLSTALLTEMTKRAGLTTTFEMVVWKDGYERAQKDRETCLYSTARIESREKLFHWVGPLAMNRWGMFGKTDFPLETRRIEDLRKYTIGGVTNDAKLEYLAQYALTNIKSVTDDAQNPRRLKLAKDDPDHIDLWITNAYTARKVSHENGGPALKTVYLAQEVPYYLACSPATPRSQITLLEDALKAMRKDGTFQKITARYLKQFAN